MKEFPVIIAPQPAGFLFMRSGVAQRHEDYCMMLWRTEPTGLTEPSAFPSGPRSVPDDLWPVRGADNPAAGL